MFNQIDIILRAIEYIECHLEDEISVSQVADKVNFSLFYFLRTFNKITHHTPYDYIIRRRLSDAAGRLISTNARIIDIAQDYCFNNQESFSRAFRRMFGIQPSQWRNGLIQPIGRMMDPITKEDLEFRNKPNFSRPEVEERKAEELAGLMTSIDTGDIHWLEKKDHLLQDFIHLENCRNAGTVCFVYSYLDRFTTCVYLFVGSREDETCPTGDLFVRKNIPGGCYVKIRIAASDWKLARNYLYNTWLPANKMSLGENLEIESTKIRESEFNRETTEILLPVQIIL